jgi:hypothetical protein
MTPISQELINNIELLDIFCNKKMPNMFAASWTELTMTAVVFESVTLIVETT